MGGTNTSFTIQYTTVDCLTNSQNYYVQLIYSNTTSTMSYVPSTTASFILTSLQPSSTTVYYTLQVFNTANIPVSNFIVRSFILSSILLTTVTSTVSSNTIVYIAITLFKPSNNSSFNYYCIKYMY